MELAKDDIKQMERLGGLGGSRLQAESHRLPKCLSKYQSNDINNIMIAIIY